MGTARYVSLFVIRILEARLETLPSLALNISLTFKPSPPQKGFRSHSVLVSNGRTSGYVIYSRFTYHRLFEQTLGRISHLVVSRRRGGGVTEKRNSPELVLRNIPFHQSKF